MPTHLRANKNHPTKNKREKVTRTHTGKLTPWTGLFFRFAPCACENENENLPELCVGLRLRCFNAIFSFSSIWPCRAVPDWLASWNGVSAYRPGRATGQAGPGRARPGQGCHQLLLGCCGLTRLLRWLWYSADSSLRTNRGPRAHTHGKDYSRGHTSKSVYLYLMWGQLGGHGHRAYCIYK